MTHIQLYISSNVEIHNTIYYELLIFFILTLPQFHFASFEVKIRVSSVGCIVNHRIIGSKHLSFLLLDLLFTQILPPLVRQHLLCSCEP